MTKSGTNQLHGSAYEFFRNNVLDARNFFADPAFAAPELRLNQFGATLGGPIQKDKTFFFGNYEGFRQVAGITNLTNVPTDTDRSGLFLNPATGQMSASRSKPDQRATVQAVSGAGYDSIRRQFRFFANSDQ